MHIFIGILFILATAIPSLANDSSVAITPKGLEFREEKGILLEQEKLLMSPSKIQIEYQFNNTTPNDIETDVAFPIPEYGPKLSSATGGIPEFTDFTVQINDSLVKPKKIIMALVNGKDYAEMLIRQNISITNFEKTEYGVLDKALDKLKIKLGKNFQRFQKLGIVDEDGFPQWNVSITYHWHMRFPSGKTTFVKHTYKPYSGYEYSYSGKVDDFTKEACLDAKASDKVKKIFRKKNGVLKEWLPYILTTANNWQKPIKDFQLVIKKKPAQVVSLCSDSAFTEVTPTEMRVNKKDYVPTKDLTVYFFSEMAQGD